MSCLTNISEPVVLDVIFGLKVPTVVVSCTTVNASNSITVTNSNIPAAGYVSGAGIPVGATYTYTAGTVTLSVTATASATVNLTFSVFPTTLYFAMFTATPGPTGGGTEVTGGNYARVPFTNNSTNFPATAAQIKSNASAVQFPNPSTAAWGTPQAWGAYDAATAGNLWFYGSLSSIAALALGDSAQWPAGTFDLTF
jgi:hypothetical protein